MTPKTLYLLFSFQILLLMLPKASGGQPDWTLSTTGCMTIPNSAEWGYIADFGPGVDAAVQFPWMWSRQLDDSCTVMLRRPYNLGLRTNFTYFPNAIAGHRLSMSLFVQEALLEGRRGTLFFEFDYGLAYYTNPYSRSNDERNVFIGSYLNCMIQVGLNYRHLFDDQSALWVGGLFAHSSNGYLKKPNKGLNYMQLQVGYQLPRRQPGQRLTERMERIRTMDGTGYMYVSERYADDAFPRHDLLMSYASGIVRPRTEKMRDRYHYAYTARVGWQYHFNPVRAVGANVDITYNTTHNGIQNLEHDEYPLPFYVGLCGNYETSYRRLTLHVGLAAYLLKSQQARTPYYERVGLFYDFCDVDRPVRHFVGVSLKAHSAHIDFIEWHYGIRLRMRKKG
jgi:hypothetical protein